MKDPNSKALRFSLDHDAYGRTDITVSPQIEFKRVTVEDDGTPGEDLGSENEPYAILAMVRVTVTDRNMGAPLELEAEEWVTEAGQFREGDEGKDGSYFQRFHRRNWNSRLPAHLGADDLWAQVRVAIIEAGIALDGLGVRQV